MTIFALETLTIHEGIGESYHSKCCVGLAQEQADGDNRGHFPGLLPKSFAGAAAGLPRQRDSRAYSQQDSDSIAA